MRSSSLLLVLALAVCRPSGPGAGPGRSLLVGRAADAIGLDPARVTDAESVEACEQIYEHLVRVGEGGQIEPELARSFDHSDDLATWTFRLRDGVRFHDGTPFDADAVLFSFDRQRDPRHPAHEPDFTYLEVFRDIDAVEKIDPMTVRVRLRHAYAPFLANLAMYPMSIVSPAAVRAHGHDYPSHPVGTGPFRFVEWTRGERLVIEENPDYWGAPPQVGRIVFVPVSDPRQRLVKLEAGAVDVAENLAPQDLQFVPLHPSLGQLRASAQNIAYLALNTRRPPFDDVRVRQAVALAIDREALVKLLYQGLGEVAWNVLPDSMWGHDAPRPIAPDARRARELLAAAGVTPSALGRRIKLHVPATPRSYLPAPLRVARMIEQRLFEIGLTVEIVSHPMDEQLALTQRGEHDLCLLGWNADNGDPDNLLHTLLHGSNTAPGVARNLSFFHDPALDALLDRAQREPARQAREALYVEVQRIVEREVPLVPLAHSSVAVAFRDTVQGLHLRPSAMLDFRAARRVAR